MKHFHIYDVCGETMCVDAADWCYSKDDSCAWFYQEEMGEGGPIVATFNWSNVVCVREEPHDDDEEEVPAEPAGWWAGFSN